MDKNIYKKYNYNFLFNKNSNNYINLEKIYYYYIKSLVTQNEKSRIKLIPETNWIKL